MFETALLGVCSLAAIFSAVMVLMAQNPVHSVLFLVLSFASSSCRMRLAGAEFLALLFLVVYVGAIAVLFLFVVMMLNLSLPSGSERVAEDKLTLFAFLSLGLFLLAFEYGLLVFFNNPSSSSDLDSYARWTSDLDSVSNIETLGQVLYTEYSAYVVLVGFVLLAAMIGSILLTLQERRFAIAKRQQAYQQISRDSSRAILLVR